MQDCNVVWLAMPTFTNELESFHYVIENITEDKNHIQLLGY